jgi:hypothetical protein
VLTVGATEVSLTPLQLALAGLVLGVAVWLLLKLLGAAGRGAALPQRRQHRDLAALLPASSTKGGSRS